MKIEMIGHASMLVTTADLTILMDPVLWDPHQEGLFDVYPRRKVIHNDIPRVRLIIISHRHLDHFDIRSLAYLPKTVPVLIPQDNLLEGYLRKLGYSKIKCLNDFSEVKVGRTKLFTTRSENRVPEMGVVFADDSGVFWNQVDTVVCPQTVHKVRALFPEINLMIASWQPMLESNFQTNKNLSFPYNRYGQILYNIALAQPRAVVPGANAFCYNGHSEWLNHIVFPISRERFLHDLVSVLPSLQHKAFAADPGDSIAFEGSEFSHTRAGCKFVKQLGGEPQKLTFSPVAVDAKMIDENVNKIPGTELDDVVSRVVEHDLTNLLHQRFERFAEHQRWGVVYQLTVIFPSKTLSWSLDFSQPDPVLTAGESAVANVITYITASALHGLVTKSLGWDYAYLGGHYRTFRKLYMTTQNGILRPEDGSVNDPLEMLFPYHEILAAILDGEVLKWHSQQIKAAV